MLQRIIIVCIVVSGLLFCMTSTRCFADPAALFEQAKNYTSSGYRQQAKQIYTRIVEDYPGTDHVLRARGELIILDIPEKHDSQMQDAIDSLIASYSGHSDLPDVLCDIAMGSGWAGKLQQAKNLYQEVIQQWPNSSAVRKAHLGISRMDIVLLIKAGDYSSAETLIGQMLEDFSDLPSMPGAMYHISRRYQWSRKYELAENIRQELIRRYPNSDMADRARLDAPRTDVLALIKSGDFTVAAAKLREFKLNFSNNPILPVALYHFAQEYERQARYENAKDLYQQVSTQYPDNFTGQKAQFDYPRTNILFLIQTANYAAAENELTQFKANFNNNSGFTKAMFNVGEEYYKKAVFTSLNTSTVQADPLYAKAGSAWQTVVQDSETYSFTPIACYLAGRCFYRLGDYQNAISSCQRAVTARPEYEHACDSLLVVGRSTEKLLDAGQISESQARQQITAAYSQIVENYPGCEAGRYAQDWLDRHNTEF